MSKTYTFSEVSEVLHLSPATIYKWESHMPQLKPSQSEGGRKYSSWEFELLKHTKRFFFTYNQDIEMTQIAVERWMSRNPKAQQADIEAMNYNNRYAARGDVSRAPRQERQSQRVVGKSDDALADLLDEDNDLRLNSDPPQAQSLEDTSPTETQIEPIERIPEKRVSQKTTKTVHEDVHGKASQASPPAKSYYGQNHYTNHEHSTPYTQSLNNTDMHSFIDVAGDHSEVQTWKRAFNEAQSKLTQTKAELARSQDHLRQQHAAIKQLQADFNSLKELIRKEIYDLRDLVIDKD